MKYIKLFLLIILFSITNVNASSISYNWNIDSNKKIHENIIYQIEETTQNNYLQSVINNNVYFDSEHKYTKTLEHENGYYTVKLSYNYDSVNINNSNILKKCFKKIGIEDDGYEMAFYAIPEFKCASHADKITLSINSDLNIISSNSNKISNNTHIWDEFDRETYIGIEIGEINPALNVLPPEPRQVEYFHTFRDSEIIPDYKPKTNYKKIVIISSISVVVVLIFSFIILSRRKQNDKNNNNTYKCD